jgi:hypothetical protein
VSTAEIERAVDEMLDLEKAFARIQMPEEQRRNRTQMNNIRRLTQMGEIIPYVSKRKKILKISN